MTEEQLATFNQRLQQFGFETMGDYARAFTEGVVGSRQLVEELATAIADRLVVKMTNSAAPATDVAQAMKSVRSPGFEPGLPAWRADVLDQIVPSERSGRQPHGLRARPTLFNG